MIKTPHENRRRSSGTDAGFSLIELLTVIAVITILAGILIPVAGRVRISAQQAQCASNLRQIGLAVRLFTDENEGVLPGIAHLRVEDSWVLSLRSYLGNTDEVRISPADPRADEMRKVTWPRATS